MQRIHPNAKIIPRKVQACSCQGVPGAAPSRVTLWCVQCGRKVEGVKAVHNDRGIIEPRRGRHEDPLPPVSLFVFTPRDLSSVRKRVALSQGHPSTLYLADLFTGSYGGCPLSVVGPMIGAPQAVLVLEKMVAMGVRKVLAMGWCGSLQADIKVGDVVLPTGAVSEEGTSAHYPVADPCPGPSPTLFEALRGELEELGLTVRSGRVWTTDAPFRETVEKVLQYQAAGVLAVEMEVSALFTVAAYRGIELAAALVVSDELGSLKWVHGFRDRRFDHAREGCLDAALKAISTMNQTVET